MNEPYILVFGASVVDIIGFSTTPYHPSDSIPGQVKMSLGGICRNIAENLARIDINTKLVSILGDDEKGRSILEHSREVGYDMSDSIILNNRRTPTYLAILNENGEMVSAISDLQTIEAMNTDFIDSKSDIIKHAEFMFLDADDPITLEYILKTFEGQTKFILDPISETKAKKIKHLLKYFHTFKPNKQEAEAVLGYELNDDEDLIKACKDFIALGIQNIYISLDADGVFYSDGKTFAKLQTNKVHVKNVTGAGDSFVAGLGYAYLNDLNIHDAVQFAMAMSLISIEDHRTINPSLTLQYVKDTIEKTNWFNIEY